MRRPIARGQRYSSASGPPARAARRRTFAPLFVNVNPKAWQWGTDLIGYDAMTSFGSPSYYVQAIYGQNKGDKVLPTEMKVTPSETVVAAPTPHGAIGVGSWHTQAEYKDI